jgi:hypothetical protein
MQLTLLVVRGASCSTVVWRSGGNSCGGCRWFGKLKSDAGVAPQLLLLLLLLTN